MSNRASKLLGAGIAAAAANQIAGDVQTAVSAAGTTQATATAVYGDNVQVTTVGASSGVILSGPTFGPGDDVFIANNTGTNALTVYPPVGGQINALGTNAGFSIGANKSALFRSIGNGQFFALLSA